MFQSDKLLEFNFQQHRTFRLGKLLVLPYLFNHNKNLLGKLNNWTSDSMDCKLSQNMPPAQMHQIMCNIPEEQDTHQLLYCLQDNTNQLYMVLLLMLKLNHHNMIQEYIMHSFKNFFEEYTDCNIQQDKLWV